MVDTVSLKNGEKTVEVSAEIAQTLDNLSSLELAERVPDRLNPLLVYLADKMSRTLEKMEAKGEQVSIYGPDWCRANPEIAGKAHAEVIVQTYGETYALPNKYPEENVKALAGGKMDMYLLYEGDKPVGTTCLVMQGNGWAELGRSASLGGVGNQLIQDLRIVRWLTDPDQAAEIVGLFTTVRTAPDRNIGTEDAIEIMRGGQAVTHMWSQFPSIMLGGFGPMYKKHGMLEQFAYAFVTNRTMYMPNPARTWIVDEKADAFVELWNNKYANMIDFNGTSSVKEKGKIPSFHAEYPPLSSGLTEYIHGEIKIREDEGQGASLSAAISELEQVGVPFIQVPVPIDYDTSHIQHYLIRSGFKPFIVVPGILESGEHPCLWYGRVADGIKVVPTFWDDSAVLQNPYWDTSRLAEFASKVGKAW